MSVLANQISFDQSRSIKHCNKSFVGFYVRKSFIKRLICFCKRIVWFLLLPFSQTSKPWSNQPDMAKSHNQTLLSADHQIRQYSNPFINLTLTLTHAWLRQYPSSSLCAVFSPEYLLPLDQHWQKNFFQILHTLVESLKL